MDVFPACLSVHCVCDAYKGRRGYDPLEPELDSCEPPSRCWELNMRPLQAQQVSLTSEPSLQSPAFDIFLFPNRR